MAALNAGRIKINDELIKTLRAQTIDLKQVIDYERLQFMMDSYMETEGSPSIIRRAKFFAHVLDNKKLYIDANLFVGSMAGEPGAIYTYPEWNVSWMKGERRLDVPQQQQELLDKICEYWDKRSLTARSEELFIKKYGYSSIPARQAGLIFDGNSWPGGGGNLNYPLIINKGLAAIIQEAEERQKSLDMRLENREKFYFYESVIIELKAIVRFANRYAKLAREMAGQENNPDRRQELLDIAEVCERVPEKPARNLREAIQSHFFAHICAQLEQVGCGYSQSFLGQYMDPFYQHDKQAGLVGPAEATYMLKHFFIKLNEIGYYYGQSFDKANSADLGQTISLGGFTEDGRDATTELEYCILDAQIDMRLPQPPLALMYHDKLKGEFLRKCVDLIRTGIGMPQFVNADVMVTRSLDAYGRYGATLQEARRSCGFGCVSTAIPHKTAHPVEGEPCIAKAMDLTLNNGRDSLTGHQVGPETGDPEEFTDFEQLYAAFEKQLDFGMKTIRQLGHIGNMLCAEFLQLPLRSVMTEGCMESGKDVWNGGAKYSCPVLIVCGGVDAVNSLLSVKSLVFEDKKLAMAELIKALDDDFQGCERVRKLCLDAPKHGNDIPEVNELVRRVYKSVYDSYQKVGADVLGHFCKPDAYSKSLHNFFGMMTGALPTGRNARRPLTDGSVSAQPGTDINGPTALAISAAQGIDTAAFNSAHLNMKIHPSQLETQKGAQALLALVKGFMDQDGGHVQFNCIDSGVLRDAQQHPENYKDLVIRVAGFSAFFTRLDQGVQDEIIARTELSLGY